VTRPSAAEPATTDPQATDPQATEAPDRTLAPDQTDAPDETDAPDQTDTASGASTTTTSGEDSGSSTTTWWPWLLLGLAVLAIIIGIALLLRRRRPPQWPAQAAAALDESDAITTHLVALAPAGLAAVAGSDAARLAALTATFERLMTTAPDDPSRRAIAEIHEPLRALHARLDAVTLGTTAPSQQDVDDLAAWATALHAATSFARARLVPPRPQQPLG
jgi:hypothetical protein